MSIIDKLRKLFGFDGSEGTSGEAGVADAPEPCPESGAPVGGEMISCQEALRAVQEYLDGELEGVSEERVKAHFDVCGRCYPHLKFETSFKEAVRRAGAGEAAPPALRARVAALVVEAGGADEA